jgi:hypothetical protein
MKTAHLLSRVAPAATHTSLSRRPEAQPSASQAISNRRKCSRSSIAAFQFSTNALLVNERRRCRQASRCSSTTAPTTCRPAQGCSPPSPSAPRCRRRRVRCDRCRSVPPSILRGQIVTTALLQDFGQFHYEPVRRGTILGPILHPRRWR